MRENGSSRCFFQGTECRGVDEEEPHQIWSVGIRVDVLQTVGWSRHALVGVVVTDEVHDWDQ